ncbi:MAG: hypothetical protein AAF653_02610, partial [Chloroflexota bacterium]
AHNADVLREPFLFFLSWAHAPENPPQHPAGLHTLTSVTLHMPDAEHLSPPLQAAMPVIQVVSADAHHIALTFDDGSRGQTLDLRPFTSLSIVY